MPLPVLSPHAAATPQDLVRHFHRSELLWTRHLAEETALDAGTAFHNAELSRVWDANRMLDAAVPEGQSVQSVLDEVKAHFADLGLRCAQWTLNPSAPEHRTAPLAAHLQSEGWTRRVLDIMHLTTIRLGPLPQTPELTIIPARASFRHARQLAEDSTARWTEPQVAEARMLHLDDPHYDAWIALSEGAPVAQVGVLAAGEVGRIEDLYVVPSHRRRGLGRIMMDRAMEICARSLFKHVLLSVDPGNDAAKALYESLGFRRVGEFVTFIAPAGLGADENE